MTTYTYQILRYQPDQVNGEFINLGLLLSGQADNYVKFKAVTSFQRAKALYPKLVIKDIRRIVKGIAAAIRTAGSEWKADTQKKASFSGATVLPYDDSALSFTVPTSTLVDEPQQYFHYLYDRMIRVDEKQTDSYKTDRKVWKNEFEQVITRFVNKSYISKRKIATETATISFDHAIKNGSWHYLEPVNWQLQDRRKVIDKLYKYQGRIRELSRVEQDANLYLLSSMPQDQDLSARIEEELKELNATQGLRVEVVTPDEAESLGRKLAGELTGH